MGPLSPGNPGHPLIPGGPLGHTLHGGGFTCSFFGQVAFGVIPGLPGIPAGPGVPGLPAGPIGPLGPLGPGIQHPNYTIIL